MIAKRPVPPWAGNAAWTHLEIHAPDCHHFLQAWRTWLGDTHRPRLLHFVAVLPATRVAHWSDPDVSLTPSDRRRLGRLTVDGCPVEPGFHRYLFNGGRVSLTLCVGSPHELLSELNFEADEVTVQQGGDELTEWDSWTIKTLLRRFRRGTKVFAPSTAHAFRHWMQAQGVAWNGDHGVYAPRWEPRKRTADVIPAQIGRCAVVGAGLSGASVARALALRGWQVDVFDSHETPASGASGLPVGLVVPHVSADDAPRSRMSRTGTLLMHQHATHLLRKGQDWQPDGVMEMHRNPDRSGPMETDTLWHPSGAWIKPASLVNAWLKHPRIHFHGGLHVTGLERQGNDWKLQWAKGSPSAAYPLVIIANAWGATELLRPLLNSNAATDAAMAEKLGAFRSLHGNLSGGIAAPELQASFPSHPCNGHGSFIGNVPTGVETRWYAGATFETDAKYSRPDTATLMAQHDANFLKLRELLPTVADALRPAFEAGTLLHWGNTRCVTHDRLPLVGPIYSDKTSPLLGLWMAVGMGARGLTYAALCAELLVARLGREPMPIPLSLAKGLDSQRVKRQRSENSRAA